MFELAGVASKLETILNTNELGKTFRIFSNVGELKKRNTYQNEYRNGLIEFASTPQTISLNGLEFTTSSINLTLYANIEARSKDDDGNYIEVEELAQIANDTLIQPYNCQTLSENFGGDTYYSTTWIVSKPTTLPKGSLGYINECLPMVINIGLTVFENGFNSNQWEIQIDGKDVDWTKAVLTRTKVAEQQPLIDNRSTKTTIQANGLGIDLVLPKLTNDLGDMIEEENLLCSNDYAHCVYIKGHSVEKSYICVFGNTITSLEKNLPSGYNISFAEGVEDLLTYKGNIWIEQEITVTDLNYNTVTVINNDKLPLNIWWGDGEATKSDYDEIEHIYSSLGTYTIKMFNGVATDTDWADAEIRDYLALDKFTYTSDNNEITITKVNAPATTYIINGTYYIDNEINTVKEIGDGSTSIDNNAVNVTLNNGIEYIKNFAFTNISSLTNITIPDSVYNIGGNSFSGTSWYTSQSDGVVYAGKVAYTYKGAMPSGTEIVLNSDTLGIAETAFAGRDTLKSITIPDSVIYIGDSFVFRSKLENIYVGSNNSNYYSDNFSLMSSDRKILYTYSIGASQIACSILNGTEIIKAYAFYEAENITTITIPDSVKNIEASAFRDCTSLTTINVNAIIPPILGQYIFHIGNYPSTILTTINVPSASLSAYQTADGWSDYAGIMVGV